MKSYVVVYDEDGMLIVGPFKSRKAAETWGSERSDAQWFVLTDIWVENYGLFGNHQIDRPFAAISVVTPKVFPEAWAK